MNNSTIIAIVVIVIAGAIAVIAAVSSTVVSNNVEAENERIAEEIEYQNAQHVNYCNNWSLQIDERESSLSREWIQTDSEYDTLNAEINRYNAECVA